MKIAVLGCGAIGGIFLGYLLDKGYDVTGIVKDYQLEPIDLKGLSIEGARGSLSLKAKVGTELREKVDLAIVCTKIDSVEAVVKKNIEYLKDAVALTTQNGIRAEYILNKFFPKERIITGIVMFGATFCPPRKVVHNFEGDLLLGNVFGSQVEGIGQVHNILAAVANTIIIDSIKGAKYLKLFINLNNCIPAVLGIPMQEAFSDLEAAKIAIELNKEAMHVINHSNIKLESLPSYPKERLEGLISRNTPEAAALFSNIMKSLSKAPLYGSILQSIKRGKKSEIDYINGEIVSLAKNNNLEAPLNERIVDFVHQVEDKGEFFSKDELISGFKEILANANG
ncbi:MAG: 2-dehydropantoate 2-reductase [Candidatus Omnitrophota bacterium]